MIIINLIAIRSKLTLKTTYSRPALTVPRCYSLARRCVKICSLYLLKSCTTLISDALQDILNSADRLDGHAITSLVAGTSCAVVMNNHPLLARNSQQFTLDSGAAMPGRSEAREGSQYFERAVPELRAQALGAFQDGLSLMAIGGRVTGRGLLVSNWQVNTLSILFNHTRCPFARIHRG